MLISNKCNELHKLYSIVYNETEELNELSTVAYEKVAAIVEQASSTAKELAGHD